MNAEWYADMLESELITDWFVERDGNAEPTAFVDDEHGYRIELINDLYDVQHRGAVFATSDTLDGAVQCCEDHLKENS
jgi:hypothetical protein